MLFRSYPPVKILQNRNNILSFRQNENEHVAMAWDRIKLMLRTCPSHGVNEWTILHSFYNGLNYMSRNILDSAAGGAFMGKTILEAKNIITSQKEKKFEEVKMLSEVKEPFVDLEKCSLHELILPDGNECNHSLAFPLSEKGNSFNFRISLSTFLNFCMSHISIKS